MAKYQFWTFVKENVVSITTVLVGFIALILQGLGIISQQTIAGTTLALVALLATSEIVERQQQMAKIEKSMLDEKEALAHSVDKLMIDELTSEELFEFYRYQLLTVKESVLWASPEPRRGSSPGTRRPYEDAFDKVVSVGKIHLSWISCMTDKARAERALRLIKKNSDNSKLYIGKFNAPLDGFPLFSFAIFDNKILVTRAPLGKGKAGKYLIIRNLAIVEMFADYFYHLLEKSEKLESTPKTLADLERIANL